MKKILLGIVGMSCLIINETIAQTQVSISEIATKVLNKGLLETDLGTYQGSLLLQGQGELALACSDQNILSQAVATFQKFGQKKIDGKGSFVSYKAGGNGAAFLSFKRATSLLDTQVKLGANQMFNQQKRSKEGLLIPGWIDEKGDQVFIDMAFAVTPYMLYAGLVEKNKEYIDLAVLETLELFSILRDDKNKLLHQARGFSKAGKLSEDNWSRGNGWGALALATLVRDLPMDHPKRKEIELLAAEFFAAVIKHQNKQGLWHQEMTDQSSFVETSGSGLLLYGMGIMLEKKMLSPKYNARFLKGIKGLTAYIGSDGSVSHACFSCLAPRNGTKEDYKNHVWIYNDSHAFGPVVLALAQALKVGVVSVDNRVIGKNAVLDTITKVVKTYVKYVPERNQDIAWENDRVAFRYYGPPVRDKVSSGVDIWTKSVNYSIIDKWYRLNGLGLDYHVDRGEGSDFYHMGFLRGAGGSAVWVNNKPYPAETYANHRIIKNTKDEIEFELKFDVWDVAGAKVTELKRIRMVNGTNFYQVTSTFTSDGKDDLIIGIGLTTFGNPVITKDAVGQLASLEAIDAKNGKLGTAIVVDPNQFDGYYANGNDRFVLINAKSNVPITYYVGAAWEGNPLFRNDSGWLKNLQGVTWKELQKIYR
ncbi:DUF4861 domain-containing protein [Pedobacter frigiditerrae]|uniref:DUF4861 domain-containing protein n=1 Tax=Pedobacter frigiditerrae TaxID=2530452 RepID=A0A4V2MI21_9SPHI|nr:DUF4861 family protein [Pedobacter frigiditerrae]TCC88736.1 DUF4861 domain-containing protein [Pedobacter frigiditerrae]